MTQDQITLPPAPWHAEPGVYLPRTTLLTDSDEQPFARIQWGVGVDGQDALAALIALAPVMREALERIAAEGPSVYPEPGDAGDTEEAEAYGAAMTAWEHAAIAREALAS